MAVGGDSTGEGSTPGGWTAARDVFLIASAAAGHTQAAEAEALDVQRSAVQARTETLARKGIVVPWRAKGGRGVTGEALPPFREPQPERPAEPEAAPIILDAWAREARRQSRRRLSDREAMQEGAALRAAFQARTRKAGGGTTPHRPGTPRQVNSLHAPTVHGDAP